MSYLTNGTNNQPSGIPIWAQPWQQTVVNPMPQNYPNQMQPQTQNWNQPPVNHLYANQQPQPMAPQQNQLPCRAVSGEEEIQPAEVPGNGSVAFFVSADLSKIYAKQWNKTGGIDTLVFEQRHSEPEIVVSEKSQPSEEYTQIINRLNDIFDLLNMKNNATSTKKNIKKEDETNG